MTQYGWNIKPTTYTDQSFTVWGKQQGLGVKSSVEGFLKQVSYQIQQDVKGKFIAIRNTEVTIR